MTLLTGVDIVSPTRIITNGTLAIEGDRIGDIVGGMRTDGEDLTGHLVLPGFIDVLVQGLYGVDALDGENAVDEIARLLPRFGVTAFCPTSYRRAGQDLTGGADLHCRETGLFYVIPNPQPPTPDPQLPNRGRRSRVECRAWGHDHRISAGHVEPHLELGVGNWEVGVGS